MGETIRVAVIMAGGSGERFWPLSRKARPKQLLRLTDPGKTMLAEAVERIAPLIPAGRVFIATAAHLVEPVRKALPALPPENVLGEPCKRNTAGCLAFAAAHILSRFDVPASSLSMAVLTADHCIENPARFLETVGAALSAAETADALCTIGVAPTRPETGYGYIEIPEGAALAADSSGDLPVWPVERFREKPDAATARVFAASGRHFWNSGMFFWRLDTFVREMQAAAPAHGAAIGAMAAALRSGDGAAVETAFAALDDISIDYALLERSGCVLTARADFPWDDVGALDAMARNLTPDAAGNITVGDPVLIDAKDCIVYNEPGAAKMAVAAVGVEGLAIITTADGVLVIPVDRAQDVKGIVVELKKRNAGQL